MFLRLLGQAGITQSLLPLLAAMILLPITIELSDRAIVRSRCKKHYFKGILKRADVVPSERRRKPHRKLPSEILVLEKNVGKVRAKIQIVSFKKNKDSGKTPKNVTYLRRFASVMLHL